MNLCEKIRPEIVKLLEAMARRVGSDAAGFAVVTGDDTIGYCALHNVMDHLGKLTVSKGIDVVGTVLATQKPTIVDNYPAFPKAVSAWVQVGAKSVASVPSSSFVLVRTKIFRLPSPTRRAASEIRMIT